MKYEQNGNVNREKIKNKPKSNPGAENYKQQK